MRIWNGDVVVGGGGEEPEDPRGPGKGKGAAVPHHAPQRIPPNHSQLEMIAPPWMGPWNPREALSSRKGLILLRAKDMGPGEWDPWNPELPGMGQLLFHK